MIVSTNSTIGIQCSKCGELQFRTLSAFAFSHFSKETFSCSCGASFLTLTSLESGRYKIDFRCIFCGEEHSILVKRARLLGGSLFPLVCTENKLPIGYFGPQLQVVNSCQEIKKTFVQLASELVNDEDNEAEFDNFFVVYAVMEKLGKMAEQGQLGCRCGNNHLAVGILPDRIELVCKSCRAVGVIFTDNKEILSILDSMGSIFLEENLSWFLNDSCKCQIIAKK